MSAAQHPDLGADAPDRSPAPDGTAENPPGGAAFFDVDNTLIRGASIFHLARELYRRRFITWRDVAGFTWQQLSFLMVGENLEHVADIEAKALSFVAGHHVEEIREIGRTTYDHLLADRIMPGPYGLAQAHLAAGDQVWLVTATPIEVAQVIASRLGLTGALGTVAEHDDGIYTGRLVGGILHGPAKAVAVRELARREGLDLARATAYSDSSNDLPMLSEVGTAVAVNPDAALRKHARAQGWQILDYRTERKAARLALPVALATSVAIGAAMGGQRLRKTPSGAE